MTGAPILIIDAPNICHAARHSTGHLSTNGRRTGVIFGFLKAVQRLCFRFKTNRLVFCWDSRQSFRKDICPTYKRGRHPDRTPKEEQDFNEDVLQFKELRTKVLPAIGWKNQYMSVGYESDDIMAAMVSGWLESNKILVTADEDMYQCLYGCSIFKIQKHVLYTKDDFVREYGIPPEKWSTVKAYAGCSSDKIKGIPNVGERSVIKFLQHKLPKSDARYKAIIDDQWRDRVRLNRRLVRLPFPGLILKPTQPDKLEFSNFVAMCEEYAFESMFDEITLREWEYILSGKFSDKNDVKESIKKKFRRR